MANIVKRSKTLYWFLIGTFIMLYVAVAFVSTLHAVTFFQLANTLSLAILLGSAYEIGQAAVLFSILMTENKNRLLAWGMMLLLTALQVTANVYASFKFMDMSGSTDWTYWQRAILFGVQADSAETYKVIISWISGALLPLVALGMTALVADNIRLSRGEHLGKNDDEEIEKERVDEIVENEVQKRLLEMEKDNEEPFELITDENPIIEDTEDTEDTVDAKEEESSIINKNLMKSLERELEEKETNQFGDGIETEKIPEITLKTTTKEVDAHPAKYERKNDKKYYPAPSNKMRGWHLMKEYIDDDHNVFSKGKFIKHDPDNIPTSKKA